jgi:glycosyltransferase involved in cell wall biosynthesis
MLYLDVTSSCKSPLNTGVQRVVRALYRAFRNRTDLLPMIWDNQLGSYCSLSTRELAFLERTNASDFGPAAEPEHAANRWPWSKLQRHLAHRLHRLDLVAQWRAGDALFVPEIFQDRRIDWLAASASRPSRIYRTAIFYDGIVWRHPDLSPPNRQTRFDQYMAALAGFDQVFAISKQSAADLRDFWHSIGIKSAPPVTIHALAVDEAEGSRPAPRLSKSPRVLCVATLEKRKNHLTLLAAAERLWNSGLDFELILIGRTTRHYGGQVVAEIERLAAGGRPLSWRLHVDETSLGQAYSDCRFTVFPSMVEGFGLPILESLWHGKPCLCDQSGAIAETAQGGGCRLTDVRSEDALTDAMRELLIDDTIWTRLSSEAAARRFPTWADYVTRVQPEIFPARSTA